MNRPAIGAVPETGSPSPLPKVLRWAGPALAAGFGLGVALRRLAYRTGLKKAKRAPIPVISVGNLSVGGTGKTPAVAFIVKGLLARRLAKRPAILMRGYGASKPGESNDEARELMRALPGVTLIVNPDRHAGALQAAAQGCDIAVLDDGFQHWQLQRDLDLVLVDATAPFGGGHLLPRGWLREGPAALLRADQVIITRSDLIEARELEGLVGRLKGFSPRASIFTSRHAPLRLRRLFVKAPFEPPTALAGRKVLAACGLGNPATFFMTLKRLGASIERPVVYPDHCPYACEDLRFLQKEAHHFHVDGIVVSAKDAVKLEALDVAGLELPPVWSLDIELTLLDREQEFWERIDRCRYA